MKKHLLALIAAAGLLTACSSAIDANGYTYDPWEPFNRKVFVFNDTLDTYLLKPLATGYDTIPPGPVKKGVSNFFGNLGDVGSLANSLLQLKFRQSLQILARVIDNTVYGLGGLIDVATPMGNPKIHEDFGTTLAHYGHQRHPDPRATAAAGKSRGRTTDRQIHPGARHLAAIPLRPGHRRTTQRGRTKSTG